MRRRAFVWGLLGVGCAPVTQMRPPTGRTITFVWHRNPEAGVVGYRLYIGRTSEVYDLSVDFGDVKSATYTLYGKGMWYFALTAYSPTAESPFSREVSTRV